MLAGALATYAHRYGVLPGRRALFIANNDSAYRAALDFAGAGGGVAAIVDLRPTADNPLAAAAAARGIEVLAGHAVVGTLGAGRVSAARVMSLTSAGDDVAGASRTIDCDAIGMAGGWNPSVHLFSQSRGKLRWDPAIAAFVPGPSAQAERSAGAARGRFALADCLADRGGLHRPLRRCADGSAGA